MEARSSNKRRLTRGHVMLMGFTLQPMSFPGASLALLGRTIHPGQQGGLHVMRDIPRYVKLIENGIIDQSRQALQDTADRTIIAGVIEFTSAVAAFVTSKDAMFSQGNRRRGDMAEGSSSIPTTDGRRRKRSGCPQQSADGGRSLPLIPRA